MKIPIRRTLRIKTRVNSNKKLKNQMKLKNLQVKMQKKGLLNKRKIRKRLRVMRGIKNHKNQMI